MLKPPEHHKLDFSKWEMTGFFCIKFWWKGLFMVFIFIFFFSFVGGFFLGLFLCCLRVFLEGKRVEKK